MPNRRNHTGHRVGAWHPKAKLTAQQVADMRAEYAAGRIGYNRLAQKYGCGISTVRDIVTLATRWAD